MYIENNNIKKYLSLWLCFMFVLISSIIIVGGLTRLTDSGLSITKWQLFTGILPPFTNADWNLYFDLYKTTTEFKIQNFSITLSEFKIIFWWEWFHRILGRLIGIFYLIPLIFFVYVLGIKKYKRLVFIFLLICFQGFVGWYMVSSGLVGRVDVSHYRLSVHLLIAFLILSMILWTYLDLNYIKTSSLKINLFLPITFTFLIFLQIILGAFVSGMDAGKIYNSWPLMGSGYFPDDNNINNLFSYEVFNDPSLVQFIHRNIAYLISLIYAIILFNTLKNKILYYYKIVFFMGIVLLIQVLLGILTILFGAQIILASMHQIGSIFLVCISIFYLHSAIKLTNSF